ncbi:helix-turn-helix domain-containing protein [Bacteroides thetaiotaomicron]|nr:helix-turn-helix domain-containing protein [Bacteroides thetaiotaomicron]
MEVITFESEAYKALVGKIEKNRRVCSRSAVAFGRKKEAWLDSNQLAEALGISTRTLQRLRDENLISYSMLRGRCMYKLSEVERCLEERTIRCKPQTLEDFRKNYLTRTGNDKKG